MFEKDLKFVDKLISRDAESWDRLVAAEVLYLEAIARQVGLDSEDARDCVQKSLASLWEDDARILRAYQGLSTLRTYLAKIIHRDCLDFFRAEKRQKRKISRKSGAYIMEDIGVNDGDIIDRLDLEELLNELESKDRLLVKFIYYDSLSREEVASAFGTKTATIDVWHFRLKGKLRRLAGVEDGEMIDGDKGKKSKGVWSWLI